MAKVNVKFMALNLEGEVASGIVCGCPSIQALRDKLENEYDMAVFYIEQATDEEVAAAKRDDERG